MHPSLPRPAIVCAVYFLLHLAAHFSAAWFEVAPGISIWYPPAGLALSLLVLLGLRYAPVVLLANIAGAILTLDTTPWWAALAFPLAITATYATTSAAVRRVVGTRLLPGTPRDTLVFGVATTIGPAVIALIGTGLSIATGLIPAAGWGRGTIAWWVGDATGILTVVPVAIVFAGPWLGSHDLHRKHTRQRLWVVAAQAAILAAFLWLAFAVEPLPRYNAFYLCFLPLVWICLDHGVRGASLAALAITIGGLLGLHHISGSPALIVSFLFFQLTVSVVGLGLGSVVDRRDQMEVERLENERQLLQIQKTESLGVLASGIAHDFNNLLTAILGNANLARLDLATESALHEPLSQIERAARRAADLCQQMLAYAGHAPLSMGEVDINALIAETRQLLQASIRKKIEVRLDLARSAPCVLASHAQMQQVFLNLTLNAAEAIGDRGGTISIRTRCRTCTAEELRAEFQGAKLADGDYVVVEVEDNGCGMSPDVRARIFEPFFTTKDKGHGLGLAAVHGIVKSHRGAIRVSSAPGRGSTFHIALPISTTHDSESEAPQLSSKTWRESGLVLVVDDEGPVRELVADMLESFGFETATATDGADGVAHFRRLGSRLRFVLLDLTMPRMDGVEAFEEMKRINPAVPIVLMSGFTKSLSLERFTMGKPSGFLPKPFDRDMLQTRLEAFAGPGLSRN